MNSKGLRFFTVTVFALYLVYVAVVVSVPSSSPPRKLTVIKQELEFVHITKTGGTTIERVGCQNGFKWGSMHYSAYFGCNEPDVTNWNEAERDYTNVSPWHTPPKVLEKLVHISENPFKGSKLFTIVRNPYTRFVSEYHCPYAGYRGDDKMNPRVMNAWIVDKIMDLQIHKYEYVRQLNRSKQPEEVELDHRPHYKHFLNQADYVYDNEGNKIVDHVLHYEHMEEEFNNLMARYDLGFTLPTKEEMDTYGSDGPKLTYKDLDMKSIMKINEWAAPDFLALGYQVLRTYVDEVNNDYDTELRPLADGYDPSPVAGPCARFLVYHPGEKDCIRGNE